MRFPKPPSLTGRGRLWLKAIHLSLSVVWLGTAICMNVLRIDRTPEHLEGIDTAVLSLDHFVIVPASLGALITGFLESALTTWGFFRYRWVMLKWFVTVGAMLYGSLFQAQWARKLAALSHQLGTSALQDPTYSRLNLAYAVSGLSLIVLLGSLPLVSVLKPWTRRR